MNLGLHRRDAKSPTRGPNALVAAAWASGNLVSRDDLPGRLRALQVAHNGESKGMSNDGEWFAGV